MDDAALHFWWAGYNTRCIEEREEAAVPRPVTASEDNVIDLAERRERRRRRQG